jgi:Na+-translocating ferredoxin:NAD+ oxidoreductase RnfD subunit
MSTGAAVAMPKKGGWFAGFKPFLAPLLITAILAIGNYQYSILEGHAGTALLNGTALAIFTSILLEVILGKLVTGRWPHLASCYITGISVGILLRSTQPWPYALCSTLAITSKYALRVRGRHIWNPSNLGVSLLLLLLPEAVAPLSQQWGNALWVPVIILALGSLILYSLGRLHITLTYVAAFGVLSVLRSQLTGRTLQTELGVLTAPSILLFIFFMITDPKTTTRTKSRQCAVAILVAIVETIMRLYRVIHAPYYALFLVAPVTNLVELWWDARRGAKAESGRASAPAFPAGVPSREVPAPTGPPAG